MKIAQLAQLWVGIPPNKYGGAGLVVSNLTEELVRRGHEVTIFAPGDTKTMAKLRAVVPKSTIEMGIDWNDLDFELLNIADCYERADQFDVIHAHLSASNASLFFANLSKTPTVFTIHNSFLKHEKNIQELINSKISDLNFISISKKFQELNSQLNYIGNAYNGISVDSFDFNNNPKDYLAWLGRFDESKGAKEAIQVARKLGKRLLLAGRVLGEAEKAYFDKEVKPFLGDKIEYIGEVDHQSKNELLKNAYATLIPTNWEEPFGLVTVEALACGSPVIAFDRGANREILKDGKIGFLINAGNIEDMAKAVLEVEKIDRIECRKHVEDNFSVAKMVDSYEEIYKLVIQK